MNIENLKVGEEIFYASRFYEVAEIKEFPHGKMVGIFDEPPSKHIDYLNPSSVNEVYPCNNCQGGGCPTCSGYGRIVGS
jgi:hypothetical protein